MNVKKDLPLTHKFLEKHDQSHYILLSIIIVGLITGGFYIAKS